KQRGEVSFPLVERRVGASKPAVERVTAAVNCRQQNCRSTERELQIRLDRTLFVVGQTGPLRIEQSPAMSPKAPVPSVSARVDRGVGKNRRYEWRERIEQSPPHERLVLEIHADLERGGLAHHSRPALP